MASNSAGLRATCEEIFRVSAELAGEATQAGHEVCLDGIGTLVYYALCYLHDHDGTLLQTRDDAGPTLLGVRSPHVRFSVVATPLPPSLKSMYSQTSHWFGAEPFHQLPRDHLATINPDHLKELAVSLNHLVRSIPQIRSLNLSITLLRILASVVGLPNTVEATPSDYFILRAAASLQWDAEKQHVNYFFFESDDWIHSARTLFGSQGYFNLICALERHLVTSSAVQASKWESSQHLGIGQHILDPIYEKTFRFYLSWLKETFHKMRNPGRRPSLMDEPFGEPGSFVGGRRPSVIDLPPEEERSVHPGELSEWIREDNNHKPRRPSATPSILPPQPRTPLVPPEYDPAARPERSKSSRGGLSTMKNRLFKSRGKDERDR
ncbi:hypothetical protein JCM6882_004647 [Rhodosporidiobolus microsporus]